MLSEVLSALKELRSQLQDQLARQPEYRALLILDRATSQLGDVVAPPLECDRPAVAEIPPANQPRVTIPIAPSPGRLTVVRNAAPARDRGDGAQRATPADPSAPARLAEAPRAQAGGAGVPPPFRPPDTMTDARRRTSDAALPPPAAANPFAGVAQHTSATIAEFRTAAAADGAQLRQANARRHANLATAPTAATDQVAQRHPPSTRRPPSWRAAPTATAAEANAPVRRPPEKTLQDRAAVAPRWPRSLAARWPRPTN